MRRTGPRNAVATLLRRKSSAPLDGTRTPSLRHNVDYLRLTCAQALSSLGSRATVAALPLLILSRTHSPLLWGLTTFLEICAMLAVFQIAGALVDRYGYRPTMLACDGVRFVALMLLGCGVVLHVFLVPLVLAVAILDSVFGVPFPAAASGVIRSIVPAADLRSALAVSQVRTAVATIAGPLVGAALYGVRPAVPFFFDAGSYLASAVLILAIRIPVINRRVVEERTGSLVRDVVLGWSCIRRTPFFRFVTLNSSVTNFCFVGVYSVLVTEAVEQGSHPVDVSLITTLSGAANLVGLAFASMLLKSASTRALIVFTSWTGAVTFPLLAVLTDMRLAGLVLAASCLLAPVSTVAIQARIVLQAPPRLLGRVQTSYQTITGVAASSGSVVATGLIGVVPPGPLILLFTGILAVQAVFGSYSAALR